MSCFRAHRPAPSRRRIRRSCQNRLRAGHTLIEILLALGLSLVILAAAYAALDQHWRYAEAGQQQTERMQITRALFERISLDLRSVVFQGRSIGINGNSERLILQLDLLGDERSVGPQLVRWQMSFASTAERGMSGLARIARDARSLETAATISPDDVLADEVKSIRFRYFARGNWFDQWDSSERRELPQGVEVTIGFREALPADRAASSQTQSGEYRLIVPVPASEARAS